MALQIKTIITNINLAWDVNGTFKGGGASEADIVLDDEDGSEVARRERNALPIAGSVQPGMLLSQLFSETEAQLITSLDAEKRRADAAEARVRELEDQLGGT